jgi:hypothetical protein
MIHSPETLAYFDLFWIIPPKPFTIIPVGFCPVAGVICGDASCRLYADPADLLCFCMELVIRNIPLSWSMLEFTENVPWTQKNHGKVSGGDSSRNQAQKKRVMESHGKCTPNHSNHSNHTARAWHEVLALGSWWLVKLCLKDGDIAGENLYIIWIS